MASILLLTLGRHLPGPKWKRSPCSVRGVCGGGGHRASSHGDWPRNYRTAVATARVERTRCGKAKEGGTSPAPVWPEGFWFA